MQATTMLKSDRTPLALRLSLQTPCHCISLDVYSYVRMEENVSRMNRTYLYYLTLTFGNRPVHSAYGKKVKEFLPAKRCVRT